ncbi:MAG: nuclear transport factor 2 family protein [Solirubrobacterales bacterium]|nr:nuclear transport factor 2 family protein [Solirubrobacterales bacterium]
MSQENVARHQEAIDAFNARDFAALLALMDDEVDAVGWVAAIEGSYQCHQGIRSWWDDLVDAFPDWRIEVRELRDLGDVTVSKLRAYGHGAGSDIPMEITVWQVARWRGGKCVWWRSFQSEAEALEAVGLTEQAMSQENVEIVRQSIAVSPRSRRRLVERLAVGVPGLFAPIAALVFRLPPKSRVRQAIVRHVVLLGFEAVNRDDLQAAFALYDSNIEVVEPPSVAKLGLTPVPRGREGRIHVQRRWHAEWGEVRMEPYEVLDLGERVVVFSRMKGTGLISEAPFESDCANVITLSAGRVIREEIFLDRTEALEAVGLAE